MNNYFKQTVNKNIDESIVLVTEKLKEKGFGILHSINIKNTFKEKIDKDFRPYTILGACNPNFAYEGLNIEKELGAFLPCNIYLQQEKEGETIISTLRPESFSAILTNKELLPVLNKVEEALATVFSNLK